MDPQFKRLLVRDCNRANGMVEDHSFYRVSDETFVGLEEPRIWNGPQTVEEQVRPIVWDGPQSVEVDDFETNDEFPMFAVTQGLVENFSNRPLTTMPLADPDPEDIAEFREFLSQTHHLHRAGNIGLMAPYNMDYMRDDTKWYVGAGATAA